MATNIPAKNFDIKRFTVTATIELGVAMEATQCIRYIKVQCVDAADVRLSFTPGGCFSPDNFFTIKSGENWEINDIALYPRDNLGTFFYCLSEVGTVTLEVMWAQA